MSGLDELRKAGQELGETKAVSRPTLVIARFAAEVLSDTPVLGILSDRGFRVVGSRQSDLNEVVLILEVGLPWPPEGDELSVVPEMGEVKFTFTEESYGRQKMVRISHVRWVDAPTINIKV